MHGFLGFNHIGPLEYFTGVREMLRWEGFDVHAPTVDPLGVFERRAYEWFYGRQPNTDDIENAERIFQPRGAAYRRLDPRYRAHLGQIYLDRREPPCLITHSQSALDARYLLSPDGIGDWLPYNHPSFPEELRDVRIRDTVASVAAVAGPHNGVGYADDEEMSVWLLRQIMRPGFDRLVSGFSHDTSDIDHAVHELGRRHMLDEFNPRHRDADIPWYSVAGVTNEFQVTFFLRDFYEQLRWNPRFEQEHNDGLVPISSAKWPRTRHAPPGHGARRDTSSTAPGTLHPPERRDNWHFLGVVYADHVDQIGLPIAIPRNHLFRTRHFYTGLARILVGETDGIPTLRANGTWTGERPADEPAAPTAVRPTPPEAAVREPR